MQTTRSSQLAERSARRPPRYRRRSGTLIIWCSFLLVVMIGMTGLVIDGGFLMSSYRHTQNAADAAAMAAAYAKMRGLSNGAAIASGQQFVTDPAYNNIPNATVTINIPPASGPYAGNSNYAEAIVARPLPTYFIHVLPGVAHDTTVSARAVAGREEVALQVGLGLLDPTARPGLRAVGNGNIYVDGNVIVNSEGGGVDENGNSVNNGQSGNSVTLNGNATVTARNVYTVGGVNSPSNFQNVVSGGPNPLHANSLPTTDPLLYLPTPTTANGVVNVQRGSPTATSSTLTLNNASDNSGSPNYILTDPNTGVKTMYLQPGIYGKIAISGGRVNFAPGIYVLSPQVSTSTTLSIAGGTLTANGVMFYNTGSDYNAVTGGPDVNDGDQTPAPPASVKFGAASIDVADGMTPINTSTYSYNPSVSSDFNGMLVYQRRWNTSQPQVTGNSSQGPLTGTWYAKWANLKISGNGNWTTNAQFIIGSMTANGNGSFHENLAGNNVGSSPFVFLVE